MSDKDVETTATDIDSLEEQLRVYDDDFPRQEPEWDKDSIVTPRSFLTEIGYDIPGAEIPANLATYLLELPYTDRVISLFRLFESVEEFRERETQDSVSRMLDAGGYNSVEIFYVSGMSDDDESMYEAPLFGNYLVRYSYIRSDEQLAETGHSRYGTYWLDNQGVNQLVQKLLHDGNTGPWSDDYDRPEYLRKEWEKQSNPASHEVWKVARMSPRCLNTRIVELAQKHLLFDDSVTTEPMSRLDEIRQGAD